MSTDSDKPIEYARRLYDDVRSWYDNADSKAQVVLAIDGAFLAFLTGAIFKEPSDLKAVFGEFSVWTWSLLALMTLCLMASVISAIYCLWSRIYSAEELQKLVEAAQGGNSHPAQYSPQTMWFFQMVANLEEKRFRTTLEAVNDLFEIEAMASQIQIIAKNVRTKHHAVNAGFVLAAATLILFFFAGLSYLAEVRI
ncbi:MAG TPA: hypothetical protein VN493_16350 [Thermoanaerobaculia bacterium]|nr:hypothetical protein [Thermoanaerobaculia bacterium]